MLEDSELQKSHNPPPPPINSVISLKLPTCISLPMCGAGCDMSYVGAPDDNMPVRIKKDVIQKVPNKVILELFGVIYINDFILR